MPLMIRKESAAAQRFSMWGIVLWVVLLFSAFGGMQYLRQGAYAYLVAALVVVICCAGCILRQAWARLPMQLVAVVLAVWALVSGGLMLQQFGDFETARQHAMTQPETRELALWMIQRAERTWQVGIALKALSIPVLLWLAWKLGHALVVAQFRGRDGKAKPGSMA